MKDGIVTRFLTVVGSEILPQIESYRSKQVNKFYREKELDWGGDPVKMERYKNRVRVVDIFLPSVRRFLSEEGFVKNESSPEKHIP